MYRKAFPKGNHHELALQHYGFTIIEDAPLLEEQMTPVIPKDFTTMIPYNVREAVFQAFDKFGVTPNTRGEQRLMVMIDAMEELLKVSPTDIEPEVEHLVRVSWGEGQNVDVEC